MKIKNILVVGLVTLSILGVMEMACRIYGASQPADRDFRFYIRQVDNDLRLAYVVEDPLLMWSLKPDYKNGLVSISSQGFRDIEYDRRKPPDVFRILCLGDSSTFGLNIPIEHTYHTLLEERLRPRREITGRRYQVINAGVIGYTSLQGLVLFRSKAAAFRPDLVTAYFGINETVHSFHLSDKDIMKPGRPRWLRIFVNKWLLKSDLVGMLRRKASDFLRKNRLTSRHSAARVSPRDYRDIILQLKAACDQSGSRLLLISPALLCELYETDWRAREAMRYRKILETTAAEAGIPLLTIPELTEYAKGDSSDLFLPEDSLHPSQAGHNLIMQRLYAFMIENGILK